VLSRFEFFVAVRYLTARRKQAVISLISVISVAGVASGVALLVIVAAATNGFQNTMRRNLLGATPHVTVLEREVTTGIEQWPALAAKCKTVPNVKSAAPTLYDGVMFTGPIQSTGGYLKGIASPDVAPLPEPLRRLKEGAFEGWKDVRGYPPIILGSALARHTGMGVGNLIGVLSRHGELTPLGPRHIQQQFRVVGIFETGFYDFDNNFAFTSLEAVQRVLGLNNVVNAIEIELEDIYQAPETAAAIERILPPNLNTTTWMVQYRGLFAALRGERIMAMVILGLIQLVGALNILVTLTMMVMEKHRDIALLMAMGTRRSQISRIFFCQGALIGAAGTGIGLVAGHVLCYLADRGKWISLDEAVYTLGHMPFQPRMIDAVLIAAAALTTSFLATLWPARSATQIAPAEALRYE